MVGISGLRWPVLGRDAGDGSVAAIGRWRGELGDTQGVRHVVEDVGVRAAECASAIDLNHLATKRW